MPKLVTNTAFVNKMMTHSSAGVLKQAFVIEAIRHYSEVQAAAPPWQGQTLINQDAWKACANECLEALNNRNKS